MLYIKAFEEGFIWEDCFEEEKAFCKFLKEEEYLKKNILKRESVKNRTFSRKNFDRAHNVGR